MATRRAFLAETAGAVAGLAFVGCGLLKARPAAAQTARRQVTVAGKRVKTVDVHAHCAVPEAMALMSPPAPPPGLLPQLLMGTPQARLAAMDTQGIDMQALSINPYWYRAERDVATRICQIQNEKLAEICAAASDRFVSSPPWRSRIPISRRPSSRRA
jgi:aminocarboxymuconate-semialdehyde decarboxylase